MLLDFCKERVYTGDQSGGGLSSQGLGLAEDTVNKQKTSRCWMSVYEASVDVTAAPDLRSNLDQVTKGAL